MGDWGGEMVGNSCKPTNVFVILPPMQNSENSMQATQLQAQSFKHLHQPSTSIRSTKSITKNNDMINKNLERLTNTIALSGHSFSSSSSFCCLCLFIISIVSLIASCSLYLMYLHISLSRMHSKVLTLSKTTHIKLHYLRPQTFSLSMQEC